MRLRPLTPHEALDRLSEVITTALRRLALDVTAYA